MILWFADSVINIWQHGNLSSMVLSYSFVVVDNDNYWFILVLNRIFDQLLHNVHFWKYQYLLTSEEQCNVPPRLSQADIFHLVGFFFEGRDLLVYYKMVFILIFCILGRSGNKRSVLYDLCTGGRLCLLGPR